MNNNGIIYEYKASALQAKNIHLIFQKDKIRSQFRALDNTPTQEKNI